MNDYKDQIIPNAVITVPRKDTDYIRGISSQIDPIVNLTDGNWTAYLPTYEPQKYKFDTDECTQLSAINCVETQLNFLKQTGKIGQEAMDWFSSNGYIDSSGSFALSERFNGILSGTNINGNTLPSAWDAMRKNGILPRADLNYTLEQSQKFIDQQSMCNDYYDSSYITQAMKDKAKKSLSYINVQYEWLDENVSQTDSAKIIEGLKQAPVQIGVPVCLPGWNDDNVPFCSATQPAHAVECYDNFGGIWYIRDHYQPCNKLLSKTYFVPQALLGVITIVPEATVQEKSLFISILASFWQIVVELYQKKN